MQRLPRIFLQHRHFPFLNFIKCFQSKYFRSLVRFGDGIHSGTRIAEAIGKSLYESGEAVNLKIDFVGKGENMGNQDAYSGRRYSDNSFTRDKVMELFRQPDVQCVGDYQQVYQARTADTAEKRLAMAILRDAIGCYMRDCFTPERHRIRAFRDAEVWFFGGDGDGIFSLNNVCEILHLEPAYIRRRLRNYEQKTSRRRTLEPVAARIRPAANAFRMAS